MTPQALQQRAVMGSLWTVLHTLAGVPISFLGNVVIARSLGVTDYGQLAVLTVTLTLGMALANFGVNNAVGQWGAASEARGERSTSEQLLRKTLGFHLTIELPLLLALVVVLTRDQDRIVFVGAAFAVAASCVFSAALISIMIENRSAANAKLAIAVNLFTTAATMLVAYLTKSPDAVWSTRLAALAVTLPASWLLLDRRRRRVVLSPQLPRGLPPGFWRFALTTCASGLAAALVFSRSELFFLKYFGDLEAVGLFALAFGLSQQITAPADALLGPLMPAISGLVASAPDRSRAAFGRALRFSALIAGFILAAVVPVLALAVPALYGSEFDGAAKVLIPLAAISCLQSAAHPVTAFAFASRRGGSLLTSHLLALGCGTSMALLVIPPYGIWGAVLANVTGQLVAIAWLLRSELRGGAVTLNMVGRSTAVLFLSAIVAALSLLVASASHYQELAGLVASCVGAIGFLLLVRTLDLGLTIEDQRALVDGFGSQRAARSVRAATSVVTRKPVVHGT